MEFYQREGDIILTGETCFDLALCCDCGQAFRWRKNSDGSWHGIAGNTCADIEQKNNEIIFKNTDEKTFRSFWLPYFDLERDYEEILTRFDDENLKCAAKEFHGIRILRQEPWEALCSFIISQNNNIPRIKGIIDRLCRLFGEQLNENDFAFPSYEKIAGLNENDLAPLRAGFRAKYILDAAEKLSRGEISAERINKMPIEEARAELQKINGVGPKVSECALLYGFGRIEAFPVDVWVKRIMAEMYPDGLPQCTARPYRV